mgnify:CR=1 FL=1
MNIKYEHKFGDIPIKKVFFPNGQDLSVEDSINEIENMVLRADGHGISGMYAQIDVFGKRRQVVVAHNLEGFELFSPEDDGYQELEDRP